MELRDLRDFFAVAEQSLLDEARHVLPDSLPASVLARLRSEVRACLGRARALAATRGADHGVTAPVFVTHSVSAIQRSHKAY